MKVRELPAVVINLDERTDRWDAIRTELKQLKLGKVERFSAVRPTEAIHSRPDFLARKDLAYRIGCLGCLLSHYHVIREAHARGHEAVLILEDDAGFAPKAVRWTQKAIKQLRRGSHDAGFDLLYLSGTHMTPCLPFKRNAVRTQKTFATNAYILRASLFDFLLERLPTVTKEIDVFYAEVLQPRFRCFCVKPHATFQREGFSDIQNQEVNYPLFKP